MTHLKAIAINLSFFSFQYQLDDSPENWRRNYYYYYWGVKPFVPDADYYKEMFNLPLRMLKKGIQTSDLIDSLGYQNATGSANFNQDIDGLVARVDIYAEMYNKGTSEKNMILLFRSKLSAMFLRRVALMFPILRLSPSMISLT